jgi:hypothetical protein
MKIFKEHSFDRTKSRWEEHLYDLTPVEKIGDIYFKREDKFAPLGFGSINGSKLRQCIWLVHEWIRTKNIRGVVSGSVVGSPQHPFISSICKHYGIGCLIVTGSKNYKSHINMQLAEDMGAQFHVTNIGYARALQSKSFKLAKLLPNHEVLETNITVDERLNTPERIEAFHKVGSYQVNNIPEHIENLIIPCGSCNSVTSILYGIALNKPKNLKRILLMGIGNNGSYHPDYIPRRLKIISKVINENLNDKFNYTFLDNQNKDGIEVIRYDLNGSGFCSYDMWMPFNYSGIELHPRYEGKVFNFMKAKEPFFKPYMNEKTLFWVVGNEPTYIPK